MKFIAVSLYFFLIPQQSSILFTLVSFIFFSFIQPISLGVRFSTAFELIAFVSLSGQKFQLDSQTHAEHIAGLELISADSQGVEGMRSSICSSGGRMLGSLPAPFASPADTAYVGRPINIRVKVD
jgi:hypothetical protein